MAICATDGVFGYVQTPGEVEFHVLDTLEAASDLRDWSRLLQRVLGYTADDATLVLSAVGFGSFRQLRAAFPTAYGARPRDAGGAVRQRAAWRSRRASGQPGWPPGTSTATTYTSLMPTTAPPPRGR